MQHAIDLTPLDTKTDEPRRIYYGRIARFKSVIDHAAKIRRKDQELVFVHSNGKAHYKMDLDRKIKAACKKAKVDPCNFHDLRHTFNTNMLKAGVDQVVIMKMTGHKTLEMFIRYHHMDDEQADNAMDRFNSYLTQDGASSKEKGKQAVNDDA